MGRKLTGVSEPTPVVNIKGAPGSYFEGKLQSMGREVKMKRGKGIVFDFLLGDTDMGISLKDAKGAYNDITSIEAGTLVAVFAPTVLAKALAKATLGDVIRFVYLGKLQGKESGTEYHNYDVEVV